METKKSTNQWDLVAPCGLYCGECAAFFNKKCGGCRSNKGLSKKYRKYCQIYDCSANKKLKICLECQGFPCKFFKKENRLAKETEKMC